MDAQHFDALARVLSTSHRRGLLGLLLTLPVLGGLLAVLGFADDAGAKKRGKGKNDNDNTDVAADKNKNKRRKKQCKKKKARACDGGRCGTVTFRCKKGKGKKAKQHQIDCGPCAVCEPACGACFICDEANETCVVDPAQQGDPCGATGQICQADGTCACDDETCPGGASCQPDGTCSAVCGGTGCFDGDSCEPGDSNDACGTGGETCDVCTGDEFCFDGACVVPACDVCASGCPFTSVQAAIDAASAGATITVCAGTYQEGEELLIATSLTLIGAGDGEDGTILDGQGLGRVVRVVADTTVDLQGLRITGGNTGGAGEPGGGIRNDGTLTLTGCTVIDNAATGDGGGLYTDSGEMTLTDCTVSGNTAAFSGGGINNDGGILTLTDSTVSGNFTAASGGGILNFQGTVTLTDSTVRDNTADDRGGGIRNDGTLTLIGSTVRGNEVNTDGGGIYSTSGTVTLAGDSRVCENTDQNLPSNCAGFTPPAGACTEDCTA